MRIFRKSGALAAAVMVCAALLTGCDSAAPGGGSASQEYTDEIGALLGESGIEVVPFAGGDPVYEVEGDPVLSITDWQLIAIADATPVTLRDADAPTEYGGIVTSSLRDTTAELPEVAGEAASQLTPDAVVFAWWIFADSPRADAVRELFGERPLAFVTTIPLGVLTFFLADVLADAGYAASDSATAAGGGHDQVYAMAAGGVVAGGVASADPCAAVSGAIDDVNQFLDDMGVLGSVIRDAIGEAIDGLDAVSGGVLTMVKRAIAVANIVLNTATLLTPWKVEMTYAPTAQRVAADTAGTKGVMSVRLDGVAAQPPKEVQSCLALVGVIDPSSQIGTRVEWVSWDGYVGALPSTVVPGTHEDALDADNTARWPFTTGAQTLDPTRTYEERTDLSPSMTAILSRADVAALTAYIRSLDSPAVQAVLGGTLESISTAIELAANPDATTRGIPVVYLSEKGDAPPPVTPADPGDANAPPAIEEIDECLSVATVSAWTGFEITDLEFGPFGVGGQSEPVTGCLYTTSTGGIVAIVEKVSALDMTGAVGAGFEGILTPDECDVAAGYLPYAGDVLGYYVWTGNSLKGTFYWKLGETDNGALAALARAAAFCTH